jgi:NADH-quinone oxidoreductase subunit C
MNDMKEHLIDLNYIYLIFNKIYNKFIYFIIIKPFYILNLLNSFNYFTFFVCLKESSILKIKSLSDLTIIHYPDSIYEFELIYIMLSYNLSLRLVSIIYVKKEDLIISLSSLFDNANWLEREIWDLFGIKFIFHNDLRRILTDYGFVGHPLLKLFPLAGFLELRYDDSFNKIIKEAVEFSQSYRYFIYYNPWINWFK